MRHTPRMELSSIEKERRSGLATYLDACDLEDAILNPRNVKEWADEFAGHISYEGSDFVLRGVGGGGERLVGALSYIGSLPGEVAARNTDYAGRKVVLVFTTAVSPVGLDRIAADCRALGAEKVEAWGCSTAFEERQTDWIDALRIIDRRGVR
jgi:hypothetical protein